MVLQLDLLNDTAALSIADSVSFSKNYINNVKGNVAMEDLNKADETLNKLKDSDVRIIYVPPMTVAAAQCLWTEEKKAYIQFVKESGLLKIKPDARGIAAYYFSKEDLKVKNHAKLKEFEVWVSIPDDMEVKAPLTKKTFEGGLYAAYLLRNNFEDVLFLAEWINASKKYEFDDGRPSFAEMLNFYNQIPNYEENAKINKEDEQADLLLPIKRIAE